MPVDPVAVDDWLKKLSAWQTELQNELDKLIEQQEEEEDDDREEEIEALTTRIDEMSNAIEALQNL